MRTFKYQIIEYAYLSMTDKKIEYASTLHKTNSKLLYYVIIMILKISRIKYDVVKEK